MAKKNAEKPFSQEESRLIAEWLKEKHETTVPIKTFFWRKTPSEAIKWLETVLPDSKFKAHDIEKAARRRQV